MRIFILISFFFLLLGCKTDEEVPKGILKQNEMSTLMWDLMRADAYVSDFVMKDSTCNAKEESAILYEKIFAIHSTTQEVFKKSLAFYEEHPNLLKPIGDSLKSREKKTQEYQNYGTPRQPDTTLRKMKLDKKPAKQ